MIAWRDLIAALGLVLVIEGGLALAFPGLIKAAARAYERAGTSHLRAAGAAALVVGLAVVALARWPR